MTIFNLVSLAVWGISNIYPSCMLRFKLFGLESSCLGRHTIENLCYPDSLHVVQLVMKETPQYHHYANLMELIWNYPSKEWTIYIHHIHRKRNPCINILTKLGANNSYHLVTFNKPLLCLSWWGCLKRVLFKDLESVWNTFQKLFFSF